MTELLLKYTDQKTRHSLSDTIILHIKQALQILVDVLYLWKG